MGRPMGRRPFWPATAPVIPPVWEARRRLPIVPPCPLPPVPPGRPGVRPRTMGARPSGPCPPMTVPRGIPPEGRPVVGVTGFPPTIPLSRSGGTRTPPEPGPCEGGAVDGVPPASGHSPGCSCHHRCSAGPADRRRAARAAHRTEEEACSAQVAESVRAAPARSSARQCPWRRDDGCRRTRC